MMDTMNAADFQTQVTSIMEMLAKTAVVEISKLFEENCLLLRLEISRCTRENEALQQKCHFLESDLQSCRRAAGQMNGTEAPFTRSEMTDAGHSLGVDNVFGKEWSVNLWRHEESNVGQHEDTHLGSSVSTVESVNLLDEEPEMIMIKEEMFEDCSGKNKTEEDQGNSLKGPAVASSEGCVVKNSDDFITYTIPSNDQVQSNIQQRTEKQTLDGRPYIHEDSTAEPHFNTSQNQITTTEDKRFDCVFCGRTFNKLTYLKAHMRTHSGEKPFVCTVCGKRFAQKTYLRIHQRTHSGERPYTCMDCGKSFAQKSSLNVHLRSHTGEKPYSCVECGKSYTYKQGFNTHQCVRLVRTEVNDY